MAFMKKVEKTERITIPLSVRKYVYGRDNFQCQSCGKQGTETQLNVDHIIPLAKGGSNDLSNLQTLCYQCNQAKSARRDRRFRRYFS